MSFELLAASFKLQAANGEWVMANGSTVLLLSNPQPDHLITRSP